MRKSILAVVFAAGLQAVGAPAMASSFGTYGGTTSNGAYFDLHSDGVAAYSGLYYLPDAGFTAADITQLSAVYNMLVGSFAGGAPRFSIDDGSFNEAWVYWGTPLGGGSFSNPNANGTWASTGNYADLSSPDIRVYNNCFGGQCTPNTGETWAQFIAAAGTQTVGFISLDLDGGWTAAGDQELLIRSFTVNNETFTTPLPAALPLFGSGMGLLGVVVWRRRKKAGIAARLAA
jgi:hypothetical protein